MKADAIRPPAEEPEGESEHAPPSTRVPCPACEHLRRSVEEIGTEASLEPEADHACTFCGGKPHLVSRLTRSHFLRESGRPPSMPCDHKPDSDKLPCVEIVFDDEEP